MWNGGLGIQLRIQPHAVIVGHGAASKRGSGGSKYLAGDMTKLQALG